TPAMGLMIAYNQFASDRSNMLWTYGSPPSGQEGYNGGNGRRGARKMIVFETDGRPTQYASAGFVSSGGPYKSYYQIRVNPAETSGEFPGTSGTNYYTQVYDIVDRIVAEDTTTASPGPGYRRGGRNVLIHCLAFGSMFEPNSTDPNKGPALTMLGEIQARGGLPNPIEDWKHIVAGPGGDYNTKIDKIRDAFNRIMQDGIQVSLLY
ncbi:MAG: hypothetical protein NZ700_12455, partial [Gemmataceae bacterium]|nr:hypothetical protein [Gemmataceae bacterium]